MAYQSTKTYGHELGLSAVFRQWRAKSHCALLHGYALSFKLVFESDTLDENGWVMDFGALKPIKARLEELFDHKVAVAGDDPDLAMFQAIGKMNLADVIMFPDGVGCEKFARYVAGDVITWLQKEGHAPRVRLVSCECREHGANSAVFLPERY